MYIVIEGASAGFDIYTYVYRERADGRRVLALL